MEAITGFTGILVFTGQSIEGIVQLRAFFKDVSLAPRRSAALLDEMENLTGTLSDIQQLVASLEDTPKETLNTGASFNTSILQSNLKSCADDVAVWVKHTRNADPREEKGIKAFFRRVKVAANTKGFEELGRKIPSHQQRIGISLSVLGRYVEFPAHSARV
jgi:hypothetical protein